MTKTSYGKENKMTQNENCCHVNLGQDIETKASNLVSERPQSLAQERRKKIPVQLVETSSSILPLRERAEPIKEINSPSLMVRNTISGASRVSSGSAIH